MSKDFSNNLDPSEIMIPSIVTLIAHIINPLLKSTIENRINKFSKKDTIKNIKKTAILVILIICDKITTYWLFYVKDVIFL